MNLENWANSGMAVVGHCKDFGLYSRNKSTVWRLSSKVADMTLTESIQYEIITSTLWTKGDVGDTDWFRNSLCPQRWHSQIGERRNTQTTIILWERESHSWKKERAWSQGDQKQLPGSSIWIGFWKLTNCGWSLGNGKSVLGRGQKNVLGTVSSLVLEYGKYVINVLWGTWRASL